MMGPNLWPTSTHYGVQLGSAGIFFRFVPMKWYLPILGGIYACYCVSFQEPDMWLAWGSTYSSVMGALMKLGLFLFRTKFMLRLVFYAAICAHVLEAAYAYRVATYLGCTNTRHMWVLQTLLFGGPSLTILMARRDKYN